jgi:hypothetical protein
MLDQQGDGNRMMARHDDIAPASLDDLIQVVGASQWTTRMTALAREIGRSQRTGRALAQRHAAEITLERLRRHGPKRAPSLAERHTMTLANEITTVFAGLSRSGKSRMRAALRAALSGDNTLVPIFHLMRTAALQRSRGFSVRFAAFEDNAPFDLLLTRAGIEAEVVCDVVSAEDGRGVNRGAWHMLIDRIDADLQTWLAVHPGRYLLKLTLPQGLRAEQDSLTALQGRIRVMLQSDQRTDHDEAAVLRLDPLMLAAAQQADEIGLMSSLRREFGHEANLAVSSAGRGVFVLAARAGREDEVAVAIRRRMAVIAPVRLTGTRPGILAMLVEDTDRAEWRHLRDQLGLEGEARQFLTNPEARGVVAVSCSSRLELFGADTPDAAPEGELRFRNPSHPAARAAALAPAVLSSM